MESTETHEPCTWSGMGRCTLPGGHEGMHSLELSPQETEQFLAIGLGVDRERITVIP